MLFIVFLSFISKESTVQLVCKLREHEQEWSKKIAWVTTMGVQAAW